MRPLGMTDRVRLLSHRKGEGFHFYESGGMKEYVCTWRLHGYIQLPAARVHARHAAAAPPATDPANHRVVSSPSWRRSSLSRALGRDDGATPRT